MEDPRKPRRHRRPSQSADQYQMVRNVSFCQVLRGFDDDSRGRVVSANRTVDVDEGIEVSEVSETDVVQIASLRNWTPTILRQAIADQCDARPVGEMPHRLGF